MTGTAQATDGFNSSSDIVVLLQNATTGLCADLPGFDSGTIDGPVNQRTCKAGADDNQQWRLLPARGGIAIQNVKDGYCMDVPEYGAVPAGTPISEYHCDTGETDNQVFVPEIIGRTNAYLRHAKTGLCLDVDGFGTGRLDARLTLWHCSPDDDHIRRAVTKP